MVTYFLVSSSHLGCYLKNEKQSYHPCPLHLLACKLEMCSTLLSPSLSLSLTHSLTLATSTVPSGSVTLSESSSIAICRSVWAVLSTSVSE